MSWPSQGRKEASDIRISYKTIGFIVMIVGALASAGSFFTSRVLADNQVKTHTNQISELKQTDKNFAEYLQLVQTDMTIQKTTMSIMREDVKELKSDIKEILKVVKS